MMKLTVSIEGDKYNYSYEVGTSKQTGTSPMSGDNFIAFSDLLKMLIMHNRYDDEKRMDEFVADAKFKIFLEKEKAKDKKT
jgi:hypothetical protein